MGKFWDTLKSLFTKNNQSDYGFTQHSDDWEYGDELAPGESTAHWDYEGDTGNLYYSEDAPKSGLPREGTDLSDEPPLSAQAALDKSAQGFVETPPGTELAPFKPMTSKQAIRNRLGIGSQKRSSMQKPEKPVRPAQEYDKVKMTSGGGLIGSLSGSMQQQSAMPSRELSDPLGIAANRQAAFRQAMQDELTEQVGAPINPLWNT